VTRMEDSQIIDLFFERSEQAVEELDRKYGKTVRKTAANLLQNVQDAEECVNDAYLGVWNSIPPHRPESLVSYVCRISRNLAVSMLRRDTAVKRNSSFDLVLDELEDFVPSGRNVEADYEAKELAAAVNRFLSTLSYDDRFLFVRRYFYADAVRDIAEQMHVRDSRVSTRLFRLREKLRKNLKKEGLLV